MNEFTVNNSPTSQHAVSGVQYAITVRHAEIRYKEVLRSLASGDAPTTQVVLKDFNMNVQKGHIYALLGASGCGKTSILKAIVGRQPLATGEVRIFGHPPNTPQSGVPGATIGYMPQDLSLMDEFTIGESLSFYGRLGGMTSDQIDARRNQLARLLELPKLNRMIETLSGGQKRRVSLSIALMHSPPILILDEPTVGVDPVLRESIWKYLTEVCKKNGNTILITTHYTEEANNSDTVGLMRHGKLMAEQNPQSLMKILECNDLEQVLVKLCVHQSTEEGHPTPNVVANLPALPAVADGDVECLGLDTHTRVGKKVAPISRVAILAWKTAVSLLRHYWFLFMIMVLPLICLALFCMSFGRTPTNLTVFVFNQETNCFSSGLIVPNTTGYGNNTNCEMRRFLSCKMLELLQKKGVAVVASPSESSAKYAVRKGWAWAAITIPKHFTSALIKRAQYTSSIPDEDLIGKGTITISMDQSDQIVSLLVKRLVMSSFKQMLNDFNDVCNTFRHIKDTPVQFKHPIYGGPETSIVDSVMPGTVTALVMSMPVTFTLSALLPEKKAGTLERELVAGVRLTEILISNFIVSLIPSLVVVIFLVAIPYVFFGLVVNGSYWTIAAILTPLFISGLLFGLILALLFNTVTAAAMAAISVIVLCFFTSGTVWPIEGSSPYLRSVSWLLPTTLPTEALRDATVRGWSLCNTSALYSLAIDLLWSLALSWILTIF